MSKEIATNTYNKKKAWLRAVSSSIGNIAYGYAFSIFTSSQDCISSLLL